MFALLLVRILQLRKRLVWPSLCSFNLRLSATGSPPGAAPCQGWRENSGPCGRRPFQLALCSALPKTETEA